MPGMTDLHMHLRKEPMEIEYVYYLKLAHGVTTLVPAADPAHEAGISEAEKRNKKEILAPRLFPIWGGEEMLICRKSKRMTQRMRTRSSVE